MNNKEIEKVLELQNKSIELLTATQENTALVILELNARVIELEMKGADVDVNFLKKSLIN